MSDHVKYVMYGESEAFHKLNIGSLNYHQSKVLYKEQKYKKLLKVSVNFWGSPEKLKSDYLDVYEGVYVDMISTDEFDEDTDLNTTYLGKVNMTRDTEVKAEESLFVIPVVMTIQKHRFEIFTLVSAIHENVDLVLGIKNLFELEGVIDSQDFCLSFLNRSIPFFLKEKVQEKPREEKLIVLEASFKEDISGMAITKLLDIKEQITLTMKLKFIRNRATFKVTNSTNETVTFDPPDMLGNVDLRSLGYYKIKQGALQQNLSNMYYFETANAVCNQFNRLINTLRRKEEKRQKVQKSTYG